MIIPQRYNEQHAVDFLMPMCDFYLWNKVVGVGQNLKGIQTGSSLVVAYPNIRLSDSAICTVLVGTLLEFWHPKIG